ncbi:MULTISPECIES: PDR/VanB family oxidoreductase [Streptomyces]|uniref:Phthalate 4,5-dioxygenase n=1 Tax=Streptomyces venezuelae TaxID=54571 RepID=A0A5P2BKP8_STRVZ|nr:MULTISPECIES: PDR/VanB family oxidoreductase [Streptomyces]NEA00113.1 oxidoreductase [Streptomyces sp. SID10116]MYY79872.1 2Fe-2S iron-sulfur cluster binding domain-containing protein [Streptomyces sp. SID335]MYZ12871.1 2Fe-2S iron-sulfur cluster binding domain-containing protein [Streptomyces sp. SID337]NDZ87476.1 oxidoreductase [Streptomyces sp. SID10115]NEB43357.1 oxidoreductase [Streptomyces sp. SID339]
MQHTVVEHMDRVTEDVVALTLRATAGDLAPWDPGAHIDLSLPNWLDRQYSLCGDPAERDAYRVAVRYDPLSRGGSEYVHRFLRPGRTLPVSLPRNHFPLVPAPGYLFLAGGIGITPLLPMLRAAVTAGIPSTLVYAGPSRHSMPFADELHRTYGDVVRIVETGRHGRPDLHALAATLPPGTLVYCCGPATMLAAAEAAFPAERLHAERFQPAVRSFGPDTAFEAVCARSGGAVAVPADESLLDALAHAGRPLPAGCREGICGSCEVTVLDGTPEHRDDIGAPEGRMFACVSRAVSPRLVLDL